MCSVPDQPFETVDPYRTSKNSDGLHQKAPSTRIAVFVITILHKNDEAHGISFPHISGEPTHRGPIKNVTERDRISGYALNIISTAEKVNNKM